MTSNVLKLDQWLPIKQAIINAIEECGYIENKNSGNWERTRENNVMVSVVRLNKIPEDLKNIAVVFINSEDLRADPSDSDHDTILARTKHVIRGAIQKYNESKEEVIEPELIKESAEEPTSKPKAKQHIKKPISKNVPAKVEKPQPPAKKDDLRNGRTDDELDKAMDRKKAERALQGGSFYKPNKATGQVPDAKSIQEIANEASICSEILESEQDKTHAFIKVRSYMGLLYTEAVVYIDFENEASLRILELMDKNPHILERWDGPNPIIKEDAKVQIGDNIVSAKMHLAKEMRRYIKFVLRAITTTAKANNQKQLLNQDWRSKEEIEIENAERYSVQDSMETEKAMRRKK